MSDAGYVRRVEARRLREPVAALRGARHRPPDRRGRRARGRRDAARERGRAGRRRRRAARAASALRGRRDRAGGDQRRPARRRGRRSPARSASRAKKRASSPARWHALGRTLRDPVDRPRAGGAVPRNRPLAARRSRPKTSSVSTSCACGSTTRSTPAPTAASTTRSPRSPCCARAPFSRGSNDVEARVCDVVDHRGGSSGGAVFAFQRCSGWSSAWLIQRDHTNSASESRFT